MSTNATEQRSQPLRTLECTEDHLINPQKYLPLNSTFKISFTLEDSRPICSIAQVPFKLTETIAVCNQCFAAFLARNLWRNFYTSKSLNCPICHLEFPKDDLKLSKLEQIRMHIDLLRETIRLHEMNLENSEKGLKQFSKSTRISQSLFNHIKEENDPISDEVDFNLNDFHMSLVNESIESEKSWKKAKEEEIERLKSLIQSNKNQLFETKRKENEIVSKKKSETNELYYKQLVVNSLPSIAFSISLFALFMFLQKNFCSIRF